MSKITAIKNKNDMSMNTRGMVEGSFAIAKFDTEEDCIYSYENAETIVDSFYERERDAAVSFIRAKALMELKKLIMGDLWSEHLASVPIELTDRWVNRLKKLELWNEKNGTQVNTVSRYLRFANYNETSKLAGIKVTAPNERQLGVLSKNMFQKRGKGNKASLVEVSKTYEILAKQYNNGKPFKSNTDVEAAFKEFEYEVLPPEPKKKKEEAAEEDIVYVCVQDIFEDEVGAMPKITLAPNAVCDTVLSHYPQMTEAEWKHFVKKVSVAIHPDKGGSESDQSILNGFREMVKEWNAHVKEKEALAEWKADYKQWKEDNNYTKDHVPADEVYG